MVKSHVKDHVTIAEEKPGKAFLAPVLLNTQSLN